MPARISSELASRVQEVEAEQLVDVVVELRPAEGPPSEGSRSELIDTLKTAFEQTVPEIERAIQSEGGVVVDRAWINRTVRAKVPAGCITRLAASDGISAIDVPRAIEPDQA